MGVGVADFVGVTAEEGVCVVVTAAEGVDDGVRVCEADAVGDGVDDTADGFTHSVPASSGLVEQSIVSVMV